MHVRSRYTVCGKVCQKLPPRTQIRCRNDRGLEACTMPLHACSDGDSIVPHGPTQTPFPELGTFPGLGHLPGNDLLPGKPWERLGRKARLQSAMQLWTQSKQQATCVCVSSASFHVTNHYSDAMQCLREFAYGPCRWRVECTGFTHQMHQLPSGWLQMPPITSQILTTTHASAIVAVKCPLIHPSHASCHHTAMATSNLLMPAVWHHLLSCLIAIAAYACDMVTFAYSWGYVIHTADRGV